jgi:N-acetylglucosamine-6-phosphate deacetylase
MIKVIKAGRILTPLKEISPGTVLIKDEQISAVGEPAEIPVPGDAEIIEAEDKIVAPGFIDTHTHGRDGEYFGEAVDTTKKLCQSLPSTGVTGLLPTLASLLPMHYTFEMILDRIRVVREAMTYGGGAEILGINMEGPYLSSEDIARGSQLPENMREPSVEELQRMVDASEGTIRKMTIAPELEGALNVVREMANHGIVPCAGHSTASYERVSDAVEAGLSCTTHTFNGMIPLHHRRPGLLGAILTFDQIRAELIADGEHVSGTAMKILLRCKGTKGIHLITDNTPWAGLADGEYLDGNRKVVKEDQRAYVVGGTLVGSVASMNHCVANMVRSVGCSMADAVRMASLNPARVIGVDEKKGSLEPGKDADLVVVDEDVSVYRTLVKGREVYRSAQSDERAGTKAESDLGRKSASTIA